VLFLIKTVKYHGG